MKVKAQLAVIAVVGILGYLGWTYQDQLPFIGSDSSSKPSEKRSERAVPVIGARIQVRDLQQIVTAVGTLQANESIDLTARVTAKVDRLGFSDGEFVEVGTPLVYLDDTEARAGLAESTAEYVNSQKLYERSLKLLKSGNTPKARVDLLLSEMQVAQANVQANKARLADYIIRAPFTGVVGFQDVSVGALVRPGDTITTLDDVTTLKLDFDLPEMHLANVRKGQVFTTKSVAYSAQQFTGTVSSLSTRVDPVTRVVRVRGKIENQSGILKPGMFLSVSLETSVIKDALMIPEHAVTVSPAGQFVFVVKDERAVRTEIAVGQREKGWVQITNGLTPEAIVIAEGLQKVRDGRKVKVTFEGAENEANAAVGGDAQ